MKLIPGNNMMRLVVVNQRENEVGVSGHLLEMLHLALFVGEGQTRVQTLKLRKCQVRKKGDI